MAIHAQNITKRFGDFVALDDVSLEIPDGSLTALLGPSGSGKSTLLRVIAGLEKPDIGHRAAWAAGTSPSLPAHKRGIGFVFQHYAAFKHMTVAKNIAFGLEIRRRPKAEIKRAGGRADRARPPGRAWATAIPSQLSGGQRQRMALARALAVEPEVLLLDEPFGALDARVRKDLREWLRRLHDEIHVTTVIVTHDQEEAMEVADTVVVMHQGTIEQTGGPRELYEEPGQPVRDGLRRPGLAPGRRDGAARTTSRSATPERHDAAAIGGARRPLGLGGARQPAHGERRGAGRPADPRRGRPAALGRRGRGRPSSSGRAEVPPRGARARAPNRQRIQRAVAAPSAPRS